MLYLCPHTLATIRCLCNIRSGFEFIEKKNNWQHLAKRNCRFVDSIKSVIIFLPPEHTSTPSYFTTKNLERKNSQYRNSRTILSPLDHSTKSNDVGLSAKSYQKLSFFVCVTAAYLQRDCCTRNSSNDSSEESLHVRCFARVKSNIKWCLSRLVSSPLLTWLSFREIHLK